MKKFSWKKIVTRVLFICFFLYALLLAGIYFFQEKLLFHPEALAQDHNFQFENFHEVYIPVENDVKLHGLLFKAANPKGLVFYLHGNGGTVNGWGSIAETYTNAGYDLFILDYRGYGKSSGHIESEQQMHEDVAKAYNYMKHGYNEDKIIINGYSIGTGFAAYLARSKNIKALILEAPYYSMSTLISEKASIVPAFINRYKIPTHDFLERVTAPVYILHGTADQLIDYSHSVSLIKHAKPTDVLIPIDKEGHNVKDSEALNNKLMEILED
jgi:alpha-beta hydrolase superfamily lysophospholipase